MHPSEQAIRNLCEQFRRFTARSAKQAPLDDLEALIIDAIERDRAGSALPDGYPTSTLGGEGGSGRRSASSTERAAVALADPVTHLPRDPHREATRDAVSALEGVAVALARLHASGEAIKALRRPGRTAPLDCECCTGLRGRGADRKVSHRGTVGDRLSVRMDLCNACYRFVERSAEAGSRYGLLPDHEQIARHEAFGYWGKPSPDDTEADELVA